MMEIIIKTKEIREEEIKEVEMMQVTVIAVEEADTIDIEILINKFIKIN